MGDWDSEEGNASDLTEKRGRLFCSYRVCTSWRLHVILYPRRGAITEKAGALSGTEWE